MARMRIIVRVIGVAGWNLFAAAFVCLLIWTALEVHFRLFGPPRAPVVSLAEQPAWWRFVPGVGLLRPPHSELHYSDGREYWTVQRANSLGFLDREPIDPDRAAESCHVAVIGDSFVEAKEVSLSDKLQVVLEEMAAREAPHLDVTTSAFGIESTGQMSQLAFYDRYARRLDPDLIILVAIKNDVYFDNIWYRHRPMVSNRLKHGLAIRDENGGVTWFPPALDFSAAAFPLAAERLDSWRARALYPAARASHAMRWLGARTLWLYHDVPGSAAAGDTRGGAHVSELPAGLTVWEWFVSSDDSSDDDPFRRSRRNLLSRTSRAAPFDESRGMTAVSLQQFQRRADHDGAALVILEGYDAVNHSDWTVHALRETAGALGIPVVRHGEYVTRQGGRLEDVNLERDGHWTSAGHRWAAEAIWEHIETEWDGKCPSADPRPEVEVDWVAAGGTDELKVGRPVRFREPFRLRKRFLAPEGETWLEVFPAFDSAGYRSVYESVASGAPAARSTWDVHHGGGITWLKDPCVAEDTAGAFFLHVFAADASDLPADSRSRGFERFEFRFRRYGTDHDGTCMVSADLPDYDVAGIRTGQAVDGAEVWSAYVQFGSADP